MTWHEKRLENESLIASYVKYLISTKFQGVESVKLVNEIKRLTDYNNSIMNLSVIEYKSQINHINVGVLSKINNIKI